MASGTKKLAAVNIPLEYSMRRLVKIKAVKPAMVIIILGRLSSVLLPGYRLNL